MLRYVRAESDTRSDIGLKWRREAFFRVARRFTPVLQAAWPTGRFLVSTADREISRATFVTGPFGLEGDRKTCWYISEILGSEFDLSRGGVLEAGANIGTGSVSFITALGAKHVHAFEPAPDNFRLLEHNVLANGLAACITTHQVALSNVVGDLPVELSPSHWGDHRIRVKTHHASDAFDELGRELVRVPATTVDSLVASGTLDLAELQVAWVDIQGHEASFLQGARSLLATRIPMVIEFWPYGLARADGLDTFIALVSAHYTHFLDAEDAHKANDGRPPGQRLAPTSDLVDLRRRYAGPHDHTNLVLFSLH